MRGIRGLEKWAEYALLGAVFVLPWQTQWIFGQVEIGEGVLGTGVMGIFFVEIIVLIASLFYIGIQREEAHKAIQLLKWPGIIFFSGIFLADLLGGEMLSWFHAVHVMVAAIFMMAISVFPKKEQVVLAFGAGLIIPVIIGAYQVMVGYFPPVTLLGMAERIAERPGDSVFWLNGNRILRAYGSFSHPNIFGGYLAVAITLLIGCWQSYTVKKAIIALIGLLGIGLLLTYSQLAWLALVVAIGIFAISKTRQHAILWQKWGAKLTGLILIVVTTGIVLLGNTVNTGNQSTGERLAQYEAASEIIWNNIISGNVKELVFGVGGDVFPIYWADKIPNLSWWLYQPVHNIPLLILFEIGVIGFIGLMWLLYKIDQTNYEALPEILARAGLAAGAALFAIAFFDHYLWTLWSGLALAALVLGITWQQNKHS